ncbi:hypothetical protein, partial [Streptomyces sp. NPDC097610]|uniref:hypothetical protein n=1 Tax=Streptomyces sp. NPDC097610 TaxID=3157227 RepID=UPI003324E376
RVVVIGAVVLTLGVSAWALTTDHPSSGSSGSGYHIAARCASGAVAALPLAPAMRGRSPPLRSWDRWGRPLRARLAARCGAGAGGVSGAASGVSSTGVGERGALPAGSLRSPA